MERLDKYHNDLQTAIELSKLDNPWVDRTADQQLSDACAIGDMCEAQFSVFNGATNFQLGLAQACNGGHMNIAKRMVELGANNYDEAMCNASINGHMHLIKYMLDLGATNYPACFTAACSGGHIAVVKLMKEKSLSGFDLQSKLKSNNPIIISGFYAACINGMTHVVQHFIDEEWLKENENYMQGLSYACFAGHLETMLYLLMKINNGIMTDDILHCMFVEASRGGNQQLIDYLILSYQGKYRINFNVGLIAACECGHAEVAKFMISKGANCYSKACKRAINGGHNTLWKYLDQLSRENSK